MNISSHIPGGRSVRESQNMLPRPHHEFEMNKHNLSEIKNLKQYATGYQTDIPHGRQSIGVPYHKSKTQIDEEVQSFNTANKSY